jgi:hypothetical protein
MKKIVIVFLMLVVGLVNAAMAQKPAIMISNEPGWHKIGEISASFKLQSESIVVLGADRFSSIKLRVTDAPINIERLQVYYESGDVQEIDVKNELKAGAETRVLDLKSDEGLKKVAFTYRTLSNTQGEQAHVELYGFKVVQKDNNAYRDDDRDRDNDVDNKADRVDNEVREEARETREQVNEETREAEREAREEGREAREEAREAEHEAREAAHEADREAREEARELDQKTENAAEKTGDEISEAAAIAAAEVKDQKHLSKVGPHGEIIFIDNNAKFYYIDKKGKKVYVTKAQLKNKPNK